MACLASANNLYKVQIALHLGSITRENADYPRALLFRAHLRAVLAKKVVDGKATPEKRRKKGEIGHVGMLTCDAIFAAIDRHEKVESRSQMKLLFAHYVWHLC
jgi:hypothetical protein